MNHLSRAILEALADGEDQGDRVRAHIDRCAKCQHELLSVTTIRRRLGLLEAPQPSFGLRDRLLALGQAFASAQETNPLVAEQPLGTGAARLGGALPLGDPAPDATPLGGLGRGA